MKYLKETLDYRLVYFKEKFENNKNNLKAYLDLDFAGNINNRKLLLGFIIIFGDIAIR